MGCGLWLMACGFKRNCWYGGTSMRMNGDWVTGSRFSRGVIVQVLCVPCQIHFPSLPQHHMSTSISSSGSKEETLISSARSHSLVSSHSSLLPSSFLFRNC